MTTTKDTLNRVESFLDESIGHSAEAQPDLAPVSNPRDAGRTATRNTGRVDIDRVIPDPDQPRANFTEESLEQLAQSLRDKGQLHPIHVRWSEPAEKWIIVSGERRWRASQLAGLTTIECRFHEADLSESEVREQQLIENCLREDLQPLEEAKAFQALMELNGWTGKQLAEALRVSPTRISRMLALLKLPNDIQQHVAHGQLPARTAYELTRIADENTQRRLARQAMQGQLSSQAAARKVAQHRGKPKRPSTGTQLTFPSEHGWKVTVSASCKGTYYDIEQALDEALTEVRHRIDNGVQIF
ncbi:MAG: ParB/RepB/Spo0J family partition protein [Planctomycetaceae bacterium]|nr:ParB/RepB/Spo0J family partition protein [Planctomycetaceae bacterium]